MLKELNTSWHAWQSGDFMNALKDHVEESGRLSSVEDSASILNMLEDRARSFGATHFLATGLPMPGRPLEKLVVRMNWAVNNPSPVPVLLFSPGDSVLQECLTARKPFIWQTDINHGADVDEEMESTILASVVPNGRVTLVAVPINELHPYQGCVIFAGQNVVLSDRELLAFDFLCQAAFCKLEQMGAISNDRPGDLSDRERSVIELTATGRTASDIARRLDISQRTVHAHLQNSSDKLNASNKTHTVVEAIRYGQITV